MIHKKSNDLNDFDLFTAPDGSTTNQNVTDTLSPENKDGQGNVPDWGKTHHPSTPYGEQGHYHEEDESHEPAYNEQSVDDNHANVAPIANCVINLFIKKARIGVEDDFLTEPKSGGVADMPQISDKDKGGIDYDELSIQQGMYHTVNNSPHPTGESDHALITEPGIAKKDQTDNDPDIHKGKGAMYASQTYLNLMFRASTPLQEHYDGEVDEEIRKEDRSRVDYGTGDCSSDNITMTESPLEGNFSNEESKNYSGITNVANNVLNLFLKKSYYGPIVPSANPNSGTDDTEPIAGSPNGKDSIDSSNENDKTFEDSNKYRNKQKYEQTEPTDTFFQFINSGGEFGQEGNGSFSGVAN